ncbi:hypothetical protein AURDEDRAFT_23621, partial [Auricularia subglabra TFB-10046 SS5]
PPQWARLPADDEPGGTGTYPTISDLDTRAVLEFTADERPRCRCGWQSETSAKPSDIRRINCIVFACQRVYEKRIEVIACPNCPARFLQDAGPDLNSLGLFNYNNKRIVTHELLNQFSAMFTRVEMPFDAFAEIIRRQYSDSGCTTPFMSADVFLSTWFGFVRLQTNGHAFECTLCGPDPDVLVGDGISAGFDLKQLCDCLRPPTTVDE